MPAMHFLTREVNGRRQRYFGGFTDERFESLPYIKDRGYLPKGWQAVHLTADEMQARSGQRWDAVSAFPVLDVRCWNATADLAMALRQDQEEEQMRPCSFSYHGDGDVPAPLGYRATGRYYHDSHEKYVVFNGYACDMHAQEIKGLRWR